MVWHSFMLNPRDYLEDCMRQKLGSIWASGMPWIAVDKAIDTGFEYNPGEKAANVFISKTGKAWKNEEDPMTKSINCPKCSQIVEVPWVALVQRFENLWLPITSGEIQKESDLRGKGYGDKDFAVNCQHCEDRWAAAEGVEGYTPVITHDLLAVQKFKMDVRNLLMYSLPMPGTILSVPSGMPQTTDTSYPNERLGATFPNRLLRRCLKNEVIALADFSKGRYATVSEIRDLLQTAIGDITTCRTANSTAVSGSLHWAEKVSCRRMMSRYWNNPSMFSLDLVGAVIRQGVFVEKMVKIDWIHSPALTATADRLIIKYTRFIDIMAAYASKGELAVPTLDVDLAWHTHQLSPQRYYNYTVTKVGKFVDHDDKIDETKLSEAFEWTSKQYQKMYGEVYSECTCWYCEAVRESHTSTLFGSKSRKQTEAFRSQKPPAEKYDMDTMPHISAHNAIQLEQSNKSIQVIQKRNQAAKLERAYQKHLKREKKAGRTLPAREKYYYDYGWGYPYPMYYPYEVYPGTTGAYYPGAVGCASTVAGANGNCAAGTCGAGIAAGGCASNTGGCGGASGGCGGAGGAGGGGCGGGDGGGGGGCGGGCGG
jgi:Glycine-rich domain-containing protein-like